MLRAIFLIGVAFAFVAIILSASVLALAYWFSGDIDDTWDWERGDIDAAMHENDPRRKDWKP